MKKKRPATTIVIAAVVVGAALIGVTGARALRKGAGSSSGSDETCGQGFFRKGTRCCPSAAEPPAPGLCAKSPVLPDLSDASGHAVLVPETTVTIGPADWEAEGRVAPRKVHAGPFRIDRFEVTVARLARKADGADSSRAASFVSLEQARMFCRDEGGRLPTEDEWIVAAAGDKPRRYPWGDTGAVCRRAAWGLAKGPCASGATGPDTVGAHPDGATPLGIHDLAGNVAEWVETGPCTGGDCLATVRGGSYDTDLATELRTWVRREVSPSSKEPTIGFRCAYDALPSPSPQ